MAKPVFMETLTTEVNSESYFQFSTNVQILCDSKLYNSNKLNIKPNKAISHHKKSLNQCISLKTYIVGLQGKCSYSIHCQYVI